MKALGLIKLAHHCQRMIGSYTLQPSNGDEVKPRHVSKEAQERAVSSVLQDRKWILNRGKELCPRGSIHTSSGTERKSHSDAMPHAEGMPPEAPNRADMGHKLNIQQNRAPPKLPIAERMTIRCRYISLRQNHREDGVILVQSPDNHHYTDIHMVHIYRYI